MGILTAVRIKQLISEDYNENRQKHKIEYKIPIRVFSIPESNKQSFLEAAVRRCSSIWMFLKISQHRKTPVSESLFNTVTGLQACNFIKKRLHHWYFPMNSAKSLINNSFFYITPSVAASGLRE